MKILLIEDHLIVRYGVGRILTSMAANVTIDECDDFYEALKWAERSQYDLVILDINIPNGSNLQMIRLLRMKQADIRILIFSGFDERMYALHYLREGADGYLMKNSPNHEIVDAVRCVLNNQKYVSAGIRQQLLSNLQHHDAVKDNPVQTLSDREADVMQLLIQGQSIGDIAREMNLHVSTVSTYKTRIFKKFEVTNVIDLAAKRKLFG
ncbi:DNA-binding response regulator [Paraflavitalea soli]|uniref:DNA-binding response regulator n=1 Tax=Paraflavitalea soli TaxID=2315862 RepID=A0A3B7MGJ0_9BACT|nr:response regulator transcription factor [Paraflavitalea soli]AXY73484.1 DNA-binding response regulator [Paraflavitalea soli]